MIKSILKHQNIKYANIATLQSVDAFNCLSNVFFNREARRYNRESNPF